MGCLIEDNVAFETFGHCFFMEDGVESGTIMRRNLGLGTRKGALIPSDGDPATFWITHANATVTHNVAAGGIGKGFWFLQPELPTGLSGKLQEDGIKHYFSFRESFRIQLGDISNNKAHSTIGAGYFFDSILRHDQGIARRNKHQRYVPIENYKDGSSPHVRTHIHDIICYKVKFNCMWFSVNVHLDNIVIAESGTGLFNHQACWITNSLFVGETANKGNLEPLGGKNLGLEFYRNPNLLTNVHFANFVDSKSVISMLRTGVGSIFIGGSNITFTNTPLSNRIYEYRKRYRRQFIYNDYTGTITGTNGAVVIADNHHLLSGGCSNPYPAWGPVQICPQRYVSLRQVILLTIAFHFHF